MTKVLFNSTTFYITMVMMRNTAVAVSFLEYSRLGNDRWQRLSFDLVVQLAKRFGVKPKHTDASATITGSRKGTV